MVEGEVELKENLGTRRIPKLRMAKFPSADDIVRDVALHAPKSDEAVDILLVNPPTPDGGLWIRTQHRVGRRTRVFCVTGMLNPLITPRIDTFFYLRC